MRLSTQWSRSSSRGCLRIIGSRYDGGTATPMPVQERSRNQGENDRLTSRKVG